MAAHAACQPLRFPCPLITDRAAFRCLSARLASHAILRIRPALPHCTTLPLCKSFNQRSTKSTSSMQLGAQGCPLPPRRGEYPARIAPGTSRRAGLRQCALVDGARRAEAGAGVRSRQREAGPESWRAPHGQSAASPLPRTGRPRRALSGSSRARLRTLFASSCPGAPYHGRGRSHPRPDPCPPPPPHRAVAGGQALRYDRPSAAAHVMQG